MDVRLPTRARRPAAALVPPMVLALSALLPPVILILSALLPPAVLVVAARAEAHAQLARSSPPGASTLRSVPPEIKLWFSESLEPSFSGAHLLDGRRQRVAGVEGRVDVADAALLRVPLPSALAPDRYAVVYRVVSVDGHVTTGELSFRLVR